MQSRGVNFRDYDAVAGSGDAGGEDRHVSRFHLLLPVQQQASYNRKLWVATRNDGYLLRVWMPYYLELVLKFVSDVCRAPKTAGENNVLLVGVSSANIKRPIGMTVDRPTTCWK